MFSWALDPPQLVSQLVLLRENLSGFFSLLVITWKCRLSESSLQLCTTIFALNHFAGSLVEEMCSRFKQEITLTLQIWVPAGVPAHSEYAAPNLNTELCHLKHIKYRLSLCFWDKVGKGFGLGEQHEQYNPYRKKIGSHRYFSTVSEEWSKKSSLNSAFCFLCNCLMYNAEDKMSSISAAGCAVGSVFVQCSHTRKEHRNSCHFLMRITWEYGTWCDHIHWLRVLLLREKDCDGSKRRADMPVTYWKW